MHFSAAVLQIFLVFCTVVLRICLSFVLCLISVANLHLFAFGSLSMFFLIFEVPGQTHKFPGYIEVRCEQSVARGCGEHAGWGGAGEKGVVVGWPGGFRGDVGGWLTYDCCESWSIERVENLQVLHMHAERTQSLNVSLVFFILATFL